MLEIAGCGLRVEIPDFCRAIETYLCRKNDGHLIRVVGPSFELVAGWAEQGIPLKVACAGIDRYFERYYRKGPRRRRPVKIDFCDADVLDVFDEWRRATGVTAVASLKSEVVSLVETSESSMRGRPTLPEHLQRVVTRLTSARASGTIGEAFDRIIDQSSEALVAARAKAGGLRGDARHGLVQQLAEIDRAMMALARTVIDSAALQGFHSDATAELTPFKAGMAADSYERAHAAAVDHLVRAHLNLPTVLFE